MLSSLKLHLCFASWQSFKGGASRSQGSLPIQVAIGHENCDIAPRMTIAMDKRRILAIAVLIEHVLIARHQRHEVRCPEDVLVEVASP